MKKVELLAPCGDYDSVIAAIQNGADALYIGGENYSARAYASNFNHDEMTKVIRYAHLRDVKVYVTVNTLFHDEEFDDLIHYIDDLYDMNVDALIIQDIGLFHIIGNRYEDFDIHMSTQCTITNSKSANYYYHRGAKRVVLARENTIEEIRYIASHTHAELEVFIHGALCVCYSGQCLMSSMIGQRSGNRGQCAQPCRLNYQLKEDDQILDCPPYLLSPKDLMTIDHIGELIEAGVTSFKIEGRMKSPEYVASTVLSYRKAIDHYYENKKESLENEKAIMTSMFNREYTSGFMFHDSYYLKGDYSGNKGILIGKAINYNRKTKRVSIKLIDTLRQGDSIVFEAIDQGRPVNKMYHNNKLINMGKKGEVIEIEFDYKVNKGNVRKVIDTKILEEMHKTYDKEYLKIPIRMSLIAHTNEYPILSLYYNQQKIEVKGSHKLENSDHSLSKERIKEQLSKLGNTPFFLEDAHIDNDQVFISIKEINSLRREGIAKLSELLENKKIHNGNKHDLKVNLKDFKGNNLYIQVSSLKQLKIALEYDIDTIIFPYCKESEEALKLSPKPLIIELPRIMKDQDYQDIKNNPIYNKIQTLLIHDVGSLDYFSDKNLILGTGLNIHNRYALDYFKNYKCILSIEAHPIYTKNSIIQTMVRVENMISDYCPVCQYYYHKQIKHCQKCRNKTYILIDRIGVQYPLILDEQCRMHILNSEVTYIKANHNQLIHFTIENEEELRKKLNNFVKFKNILN